MGCGYMIILWGREGAFIGDCWEGFHRNREDYRGFNNPADPEKPIFYFRKPIGDVIEDISEPDDRITVICADDNAERLLIGMKTHKGRYIFPVTKEELENAQVLGGQ